MRCSIGLRSGSKFTRTKLKLGIGSWNKLKLGIGSWNFVYGDSTPDIRRLRVHPRWDTDAHKLGKNTSMKSDISNTLLPARSGSWTCMSPHNSIKGKEEFDQRKNQNKKTNSMAGSRSSSSWLVLCLTLLPFRVTNWTLPMVSTNDTTAHQIGESCWIEDCLGQSWRGCECDIRSLLRSNSVDPGWELSGVVDNSNSLSMRRVGRTFSYALSSATEWNWLIGRHARDTSSWATPRSSYRCWTCYRACCPSYDSRGEQNFEITARLLSLLLFKRRAKLGQYKNR